MSKAPRVILVGLDGATFDYITPLVEAGLLPNLGRLQSEGATAILKSVLPFQTPAAWPSVATGKHPCNHGILGWFESLVNNYKLIPITSNSINGSAFWELLSEAGHTVGVVNVPLTYPPSKVRGFVLSGFDSPFQIPEWQANLSHPPDLLSELHSRGYDYRVIELFDDNAVDPLTEPDHYKAPPLDNMDMEEHLHKWAQMEYQRTEAVRYLVDQYNPDFLMVVYHITDYFAHRANKNSKIIQEAYTVADRCIGKILDLCDDNTIVMVISDHGTTEINKIIYIHKWLEEKGYLKFHDSISDIMLPRIIENTAKLTKPTVGNIYHLIDEVLNLQKNFSPSLQAMLTTFVEHNFPGCRVSHSNIDWSKTKVFTTSPYGLLHVNIKGIYPQGIVELGDEYNNLISEIISDLLTLRDPETGQHLIREAASGREVFKKFEVGHSPDIVFALDDNHYYISHLYPHYLRVNSIVEPRDKMDIKFRAPQYGYIGDHTPNGIFIASGSGVNKQHSETPFSLVDIAPTILTLFGHPIPLDMEGRVLSEVFKTNLVPERTEPPQKLKENADNFHDKAYIKETLRLLGYNL